MHSMAFRAVSENRPVYTFTTLSIICSRNPVELHDPHERGTRSLPTRMGTALVYPWSHPAASSINADRTRRDVTRS